MNKAKWAERFIGWVAGWNDAFHAVLERRHIAGVRQMFGDPADDQDKFDDRVKEWRQFYYGRMTTTAALLIGLISIGVAVLSLIVSLVALVVAWKGGALFESSFFTRYVC
ncbi:hypothetical protein [Dyella sp. ASV21]|uniref:hypothetical protein n=1 Tax=Dyella sp. ASV21 TaxID=2795114 RepID=UPI0018EC60B1|nr:hypothetical protein [Dyella sp. ASV21]